MKQTWIDLILRRLLLGVLGLLVLFVLTALWRVQRVTQALDTAVLCLAQGSPGTALAHLDRVRRWSAPYPELAARRLELTVRCHVRRTDIPKARMTADELGRLSVAPQIPADWAGWGDASLGGLARAMGLFGTARTIPGPLRGLDVLTEELQKAGQHEALKAIEQDRQRLAEAAAAVARPVPAPTVAAPPATTPAAVALAPAGTSLPPAPPAAPAKVTLGPVPPDADEAAKPAQWGVVMAAKAPAFGLNGAFRQHLPAGTIVDIAEVVESNEGQALRCRVADSTGPTIFVRARDVETVQGALASAGTQEKSLRKRRAELKCRIEALRNEPPAATGATAARGSSGNPHAREYEKARAAQDAFRKKANDLVARMEASTGAERMKYADELRLMKGEEGPVAQAFETAKQAFDKWEAEHPAAAAEAPATEAAAADGEGAELAAELAKIEEELRQATP